MSGTADPRSSGPCSWGRLGAGFRWGRDRAGTYWRIPVSPHHRGRRGRRCRIAETRSGPVRFEGDTRFGRWLGLQHIICMVLF